MQNPAPRQTTSFETGWLPALGFFTLAAGLSAVCAPNPGTPDVTEFLSWAATLAQHGPFAGYAAIADYPPLGPFMIWAAIAAGTLCHLQPLAALKLAIDACQLAAALIIRWRSKSWAAASLLFLLITPFGALLGYIDVFYLPFVLLGIFALERDRLAVAALMFAIAGLIKWQPTILCPVVFIFAASRTLALQGRAQKYLWPLPAALFALAVTAAFGPGAVWHAFSGATDDPFFSGQAFNLDWIETYALEWLHAGGAHFGPDGTIKFINTPMPIWYGLSRALFWPLYLANLAAFTLRRKTRQSLPLALLAAESIQFTFNTGVHENHAFLVMILAFVASTGGALPASYLTLAATLAITNILAFYGPAPITGATASLGTVILATLQLISCIVVMLGVWRVDGSKQGQGGFAPLDPPLRARP